jgi:glycosyltransferase involved in cell wall biosynthesis
VNRIRAESAVRKYDTVLWLGDYAHGTVSGVPTLSFAQGPPGTDARSILHRRAEIRLLAGNKAALKWEVLARLRLSRMGLPALRHSDHIIVGSSVSRERLISTYHVAGSRISTLPYPVDLDLFKPASTAASAPASDSSSLRLLWLGRIIPRKRLDVFLEGAELAVRHGLDLHVSLVGEVGFVKGYEKLIHKFAYPERLQWVRTMPRDKVPALIRSHDVLAQPSEEENFGSSVAEAQACGVPVIVGISNGNLDYLCPRDIHLEDDQPATFAAALQVMDRRLKKNSFGDAMVSRRLAEREFDLPTITRRLVDIISQVCRRDCLLTCESA